MQHHNEQETDDVEERPKRWEIDKHIPIPMLITIAAQTMAFVWGGGILYNKVENMIETLKTFSIERYTKEDARRDKELMMLVVDSLKMRDNEIERRVLGCENHISATNGVRAK